MADSNTHPAAMLVDPLLTYASKHEVIDAELVKICELDKTASDADTAGHAFEYCRKAAEAGSPFAMCLCSRFCAAGWGVPRSGADALMWAERAAETKFAPGDFEVAHCYEHGVGVPIDLEKSRSYYARAAEAGYGRAATQLAAMYHDGRFGTPDMAKALEFAQLGYRLKEPMAPLLIAGWYEGGERIPKSEKEAALWYERAAELGNFFASERLRRAFELGELGLPRNVVLARKYAEMFDAQLR